MEKITELKVLAQRLIALEKETNEVKERVWTVSNELLSENAQL